MQGDAASRGGVSQYLGALASLGWQVCVRQAPLAATEGLLHAFASWLFLPEALRMRLL